MTVAEMIVQLREKMGVSRNQFTELMGLKSRNATRYWEVGKRLPNLESAYRLLELARGCGLEWKLEDLMPPKSKTP
jgi:DNA-binding transcriptional regulator YiaG